MLTIITMPEGFTTDISANATDVIGSLGGFITLVIGVLLATLVISILINSIKHH